ncbi:MAG: hypothetical protein WCX73_01535 [Candidatus Pacearchaeota archaeon]|jgi:hypothetical protein
MVNWIIIILLIVIGLYVVKFDHFKHKIWMVFLIFLAVFLVLSFSLVGSKYELRFNNFNEISNSGKIYLGWLANGFQNLKSIAGNAIKLDWTSTNNSLLNVSQVVSAKK